MKPIDDNNEDSKKGPVVIRAVSRDEEGRKKVEKTEVYSHNMDTIRYVEKKLEDKGVQRLGRHPANGIGLGRLLPKAGHGGKYTWEGPADMVDNELDAAPEAIDEGDPNYVDEEAEDGNETGMVVGEVEVAKVAADEDGVARIEVDPRLNVNV
ncbi:hypothetical protein SLA2020_457770 [Shorea laevis]